jgi:hypothetical protein
MNISYNFLSILLSTIPVDGSVDIQKCGEQHSAASTIAQKLGGSWERLISLEILSG